MNFSLQEAISYDSYMQIPTVISIGLSHLSFENPMESHKYVFESTWMCARICNPRSRAYHPSSAPCKWMLMYVIRKTWINSLVPRPAPSHTPSNALHLHFSRFNKLCIIHIGKSVCFYHFRLRQRKCIYVSSGKSTEITTWEVTV